MEENIFFAFTCWKDFLLPALIIEMKDCEHIKPGKNAVSASPSQVDLSPGSPFRVRFSLPGEPDQSNADVELADSVGKLGLLHPPLVIEAGESSTSEYTAVYGHRRIAAALSGGLGEIQVMVADTLPDSAELLSMRVEEAAWGGELSGLEKIIALGKILDFPGLSKEAAASFASRVLGRRISLSHAGELLALLRMKDETLRALHEGRLTTGDLLELNSHPDLSADHAALLLAERGLTRGQRRRAVRLMLYLADQGGERWKDFVESPPGEGESLLSALQARCYPSLKEDLEEFRRAVERMGLPTEASITPPPNLEGGSLELRIRITGPGQLLKILSKLEDALEKGDMETLLDILKGKRA